ncbi:MAG: ATP-binding protein [bacterium]|nr:ATP-binding protein [bacterium]
MSHTVIDFREYINERTEDFTGRQWVFEAIDRWLADPNASSVFLLTGEPGSGKTALSVRLTQFSQGNTPSNGFPHLSPNFLSAYHFCSARDRRWIDPFTFSESLALQLAARYPIYAKALAEKSGDRQINIKIDQDAGKINDGGQMTGVVINKLEVSAKADVTGDKLGRVYFLRLERIKPLSVDSTLSQNSNEHFDDGLER